MQEPLSSTSKLLRQSHIVNRGGHLGGGEYQDAKGYAYDNKEGKEEFEKRFSKKLVHLCQYSKQKSPHLGAFLFAAYITRG